jgi:uncharacterized membrane protein
MMRFWDGGFSDRFDRFGNMQVHWGAMIFFGLVFVAAIVVGILLLVKLARRHSKVSGANSMPPAGTPAPRLTPDTTRALEILNERLVKGEIGDEEYDRIKSKLKE